MTGLTDHERHYLARDAARLGLKRPRLEHVEFESERGAIRGLRWGDGEPEFLFLHGGGLNAHSWDEVALLLGRPALALDLPGHGDSDWWERFDYAPLTIGAELAPILAGLAAPVHIVGHSLGGLSSITAIARTPDGARTLTLVDVVPSLREENPGRQRIRGFMRGPESYGSYDEILDRARQFGIGRGRASLERGVHLNTRVREDGRIVFKHHLAQPPEGSSFTYDPEASWPDVARLDLPVLLVRGERGIIGDEELQRFLEHMPAARVLSVDAGHTPQRENPRALVEIFQSEVL